MKFEITNKDKILFPKSKITKGDMIEYYKKIAKFMLPLIKDRPISMERFPGGIKGDIFFQKNVSDYFPKCLKTTNVSRQGQTKIKMVLCNDADSLLYLANQAVIFHTWLSKYDKPNYPDRMIFDLDPPKNNFSKVIEATKDLKKLIDELKLPTYFMTTGSRGLHIIIPIKRDLTFTEVRSIAKKIATILVKREPKKYTTQTRKDQRKGRVFIDYLRNGSAQTAIAPYSVRAIENAPVAMPISFKEIGRINSQSFTIKNACNRKSNPFTGMDRKAISLKKIDKKLDAILED